MFMTHCTGKNPDSHIVYNTVKELLIIGLFTYVIVKIFM